MLTYVNVFGRMLTYALEKKAAYEQQSLSGGDADVCGRMLTHASSRACLEEMLTYADVC